MVGLKEGGKKSVSFNWKTMKLKHQDSLLAHWHTIIWILNVKSNSCDCLQTTQQVA